MAARKRSKRPASIKGLSVSPPRNITARNLARLKGLSELSAGKLDVLAERIAVRRFRKRSAIYSEDHVGEGMYIMLSGIARLTCLNRKGERILLEVLGPGDVVGIPSLLPDVRHNIRCEAFTDCQLDLARISKSGGRRFGLKQQTRGVEGILVAMFSLVDNMDEQLQIGEYRSSLFALGHDRDLFGIETGATSEHLLRMAAAGLESVFCPWTERKPKPNPYGKKHASC
jgi:hypothetical protein